MLSKEFISKYGKKTKDIHVYNLIDFFDKMGFFAATELISELADYLDKNPNPPVNILKDGTPVIHVKRNNFETVCQWKYKEESHVILIEFFSCFN